MPTTPKDKLIEYLKHDKVIPFVGAGFSSAVAGLPGWKKLIEDGISFASARNLISSEENDLLNKEMESGNLIAAGQRLKAVLNAPGFPYVTWIKEAFGAVQMHDATLAHSIVDLDAQLLITTNYDTLLTSVANYRNRQKFVHSEYEFAQNALKAGREVIVHLHGIHEKPESIVLGSDDYVALNANQGYKSFLHQLFTDKHVLFIGCSKNGVLDDDFRILFDFIREWFVNSANEHFILLLDKEVKSNTHVQLLKECNIEPVIYGSEHVQLAQFINCINPNLDRRKIKLNEHNEDLKSELHRLQNVTDGFTKNMKQVDVFMTENLQLNNTWVDQAKMKFLGDLLDQHNATIQSKKEQLAFTQNIIRSVFNVEELKSQIDLWSKFGDKPEKLNPLRYITTATLAYGCLLKIPQEIRTDFMLSQRNILHPYFFDGYLGNFIREIEYYKQHKIDLEKHFKDDRYLFENLKRIIDSLRGFLELDPDDFYIPLRPASLTKALPDCFLVLAADEQITVRSATNPTTILASLPLQKNFPVYQIVVCRFQNKLYICGRTARSVFHWQPEESIYAESFHNDGLSNDFQLESNDDRCIMVVQQGTYLHYYAGFKEQSRFKLNMLYSKVFRDNVDYITFNSVDSFQQRPIFFRITAAGETIPLLSTEQISSDVFENEPIGTLLLANADYEISTSFEKRDIKKIEYDGNTFFLIRIRMHSDITSTLIAFYRLEQSGMILVQLLHAHFSLCSSFDVKVTGKTLKLIAGYLDLNGQEQIGEYYELENFSVTRHQTISLERSSSLTRDVREVALFNDTVAFNIEGQIIVTWNLTNDKYHENAVSSKGSARNMTVFSNEDVP